MASFPNFINRLIRPFTSSTRLGLNSEAFPAPVTDLPPGHEQAVVAAGCFWGVEHVYRKNFKDALHDARVGYIGGDTSNPDYRSVCSGTTGHAEALRLIYNPEKVTYRQLIEFFYRMHNPTQENHQGPDRGTQYRTGIFTFNDEQEKIAREVTEKAGQQWWAPKPIVTQILPAGEWWDAEKYHQRYLEANPHGYECPTHFIRDFPPLQ